MPDCCLELLLWRMLSGRPWGRVYAGYLLWKGIVHYAAITAACIHSTVHTTDTNNGYGRTAERERVDRQDSSEYSGER